MTLEEIDALETKALVAIGAIGPNKVTSYIALADACDPYTILNLIKERREMIKNMAKLEVFLDMVLGLEQFAGMTMTREEVFRAFGLTEAKP